MPRWCSCWSLAPAERSSSLLLIRLTSRGKLSLESEFFAFAHTFSRFQLLPMRSSRQQRDICAKTLEMEIITAATKLSGEEKAFRELRNRTNTAEPISLDSSSPALSESNTDGDSETFSRFLTASKAKNSHTKLFPLSHDSKTKKLNDSTHTDRCSRRLTPRQTT